MKILVVEDELKTGSYLKQGLIEAGFVVPVPAGAFYVYADVTALLGGTWGGVTPTTSLELADLILDKAEVAVVPGEAFGPSGYLRLSYALGDDDLAEGVARLARLFG